MNSNTISFIQDYPKEGYIHPHDISWDHNMYYDKLYSFSYRELLKKYNMSIEDKDIIQEQIFGKLKDKILIDLGCGGYNCNLAALAYQSNAKAYVGIDVNADITKYDDDELKSYLREQYHLPDDIRTHTTILKTIGDKFENFLERTPDKAGFNFTINGLRLTASTEAIRSHLYRIMNPGNIILANTAENLNISDILIGPYKYTQIDNIVTGDSINIYEKLDNSSHKGVAEIQESIFLTLKK